MYLAAARSLDGPFHPRAVVKFNFYPNHMAEHTAARRNGRILQNLDRGPDRFLDWKLDEPLLFLRRLVGEEVARKLDECSIDAMHEMGPEVERYLNELSA